MDTSRVLLWTNSILSRASEDVIDDAMKVRFKNARKYIFGNKTFRKEFEKIEIMILTT